MKIGLIGLPQTGKKALFELLSGHAPSEAEVASTRPIKGIAPIRDARFADFVARYKPRKQVQAKIDIELLPKLEREAIAKGDIFTDIMDADGLCHVVRTFVDDSVYHVDGSIDAKRDIDMVNAELILHDLIFIEKRLERIDKSVKKTGDESALREREALLKCKAHLERSLPLRTYIFTGDDRKLVSSYPFITLKEFIVVLNVAEDRVNDTSLAEKFRAEYAESKIDFMQVSAKVEAEIARLESDTERTDFMSAVGITIPAINALTGLCIKALNLISFFTVGEDEVRQWLVRRGSSAPEAARAIHTDLEKGFIRAEVIHYADLAALGGEEKVKEAGKFLVKGKDYIVEDGDILTIRFNV